MGWKDQCIENGIFIDYNILKASDLFYISLNSDYFIKIRC